MGLVQCSELCEGNALSIQRVILWNCTWLRKGLSLYLNLNPMENLDTGICMTENCCCLFFLRMSLSWMCSNKMILKQAVDIQWFINTLGWVLRPLFLFLLLLFIYILPRIHSVPLSGKIFLAGDRCSEHSSGTMAAPLPLQSLIRITSTTAILSSGRLAVEFIFQNKDGRR